MTRRTTTSTAARRPTRRGGVLAVVLATSLVAAGCFIPYDFTGSAGADLAYVDQTTGDWYLVGDPTPFFDGSPDGIEVPGTYDGDAKWEAAEWIDGVGWSTAGDAGTIAHTAVPATLVDTTGCFTYPEQPVPADWTGDAATEPAWYVDGEWQILGQAPFVPTNSPNRMACAAEHDIPVPADYDGDGKAEAAVHRPGTGRFWIDGEAGPRELPVHLGYPTAGDFDGDGTDEPALLRPDGTLHTETATYTAAAPATPRTTLWPVVADHDGDGTDDPAAFDSSTGEWWIDGAVVATLSTPDELPVTVPSWLLPHIVDLTYRLDCEQTPSTGCPTDATDGDLDGDGTAEIVWNRWQTTEWYQAFDPVPVATFPSDVIDPAGGDYDGDGTWEPGMVDTATGTWRTAGSAGTLTMPPPSCDDAPIALVGDWDGDLRDEPGWYCTSDATWHRPGHPPTSYGEPGALYTVSLPRPDLPAPADYDGDGDDDVAVYRMADGSFRALGWSEPLTTGLAIGMPVPADLDGDGDADPQIYQPNSRRWQTDGESPTEGPGFEQPGAAEVVTWPVTDDIDGDGDGDRSALHHVGGDPPPTTTPLHHDSDIAGLQVVGTGAALPSTLGPSTFLIMIQATFIERSCDAHQIDRCPQPLPPAVDGDYFAEPPDTFDGLADEVWTDRDATGAIRWWWGPDTSPLLTAGSWSTVPVDGDYDGDGAWEPAYVDLGTGDWTVHDIADYAVTSSTVAPPACAGWALESTAVPLVGDFDHDGTDDPAWYCPTSGTWQFEDATTLDLGVPYPVAPAWAGSTLYDSYHDVPVVLDLGDGTAPGDVPAVYRPTDGTFRIHDPDAPGGEQVVATASPLAVPLGSSSTAVWRPTGATVQQGGHPDWQAPTVGDPDLLGTGGPLGDLIVPGAGDLDGDGVLEGWAASVFTDGSRQLDLEGQVAIPLEDATTSDWASAAAVPAVLPTASWIALYRLAELEAGCYSGDYGCPPGFTPPAGVTPPPSP